MRKFLFLFISSQSTIVGLPLNCAEQAADRWWHHDDDHLCI